MMVSWCIATVQFPNSQYVQLGNYKYVSQPERRIPLMHGGIIDSCPEAYWG